MVKVLVIGGGPGGYVAAIRAAQLGAQVTLIEKEKLGGTCLNTGCIPTKTILHAAQMLEEAKHASDYGVHLDVKGCDLSQLQTKKSAVVNQLVSGVTGLLKANKVKVVSAEASFQSKNCLLVRKADGTVEEIKGDKIIIASGSVPFIPPIPGVENNPKCLNSTDALSLGEIPETMLVIGGGVIGIELATAYNAFGTQVTILEAMPKLLPLMDGELTDMLRKNLESSGIRVLTGAKVKSVKEDGQTEVDIDGKIQVFHAEKILIAVGRRTNTQGLNLSSAGIEHDNGRILVNDKMETNVSGVYAIGDCLGKVMLAHVASAQGETAAENALGHNSHYDGKTNPSCVYTDPEFAGVGLTEEQAREQGIAYSVGKFPLSGNGKALIMNGGQGVVKVLTGQEYKEILGVHILGPRATDLIGECALAIGMEGTVDDILAVVHPHPTVTEAIREGVMAVEKRAVHMPPSR